MKSAKVNVYSEDWVREGVALIFQSLSDSEDGTRIESAVWGRFLDHHPRHKYTSFYRLTYGDEIKYVSAYENEKNTPFVLFPVSETIELSDLTEEEIEDLVLRKVFLKMTRGNCLSTCKNEADFYSGEYYFCTECSGDAVPVGFKKWNYETRSYETIV